VKPRNIAGAALLVAAAAVCVRLGIWQLSRLHEKREINAALREALAAPAIPLSGIDLPPNAVRHRRVRAFGRFDETRGILLAGRGHDGSPGIDVVTPFVLMDGSAILVDRGWLYAGDGATARPQDFREPGARELLGVAEPLESGRAGSPLRVVEADSVTLWSTRWLDADSLRSRFPYTLAAFTLRQMPGPGVPEHPARRAPTPVDETMHISYAAQWFLFATILLIGPWIVSRAKRRAAARPPTDLDIPPRP
jgi:surfeit locus 1 family protein